jgi:putative hemolysin
VSITTELLVVFVLIGLSACYSAMETALTSMSDVRLRRLMEESASPSRVLVWWRDKPNDILATILIGNNFVNILSSALATDMTDTLLGGTEYEGFGIPIAVGLTTMVVLIAGEVVPKTFAKNNPERTLTLLPVLHLTYLLFYPIMRVLVRLTRGVVQRLGGAVDNQSTVTEEDIEEMVRIGKSDGSMSPASARLLTGVFELDDKVAREIMVPRTEVRALPGSAGVEEVMDTVEATGHSRFPVYEGNIDNIIGVLYVKDFFRAYVKREPNRVLKAKDFVRRPLVRPWNIGVQDLFVDMQKERVHMALIASEYGGVAGIVTLEDIIEEVFGPIYDEHDANKEAFKAQDDGSWLVDGLLTISELEQELGIEFPEDDESDYETVAGLMMQEAGRVPESGFTHDLHGFRFEVIQADAMHVRAVRISRVPQPGSEPAPEQVANGD